MKTTVGRIRQVVREAVGERKLSSHEGVEVGRWYKELPVNGFGSAGDAAQLVDLSERDGLIFATRRFPAGHSVTSRFDVWMDKFDGEASPEEVERAQSHGEAELDRMGKLIDTSREGT